MTPTLEFPENAFGSHLAFEVLDGPFDALVAYLDFQGLALNCFAGITHGERPDMTDLAPRARQILHSLALQRHKKRV